MTEKKYIEYGELHSWSSDLIDRIKQSGFKPDIVVSVAMGGNIIGYYLTKGLGVKEFNVIQVQSYDGINQGDIKDLVNSKLDFKGKKVLLVDDLVDTGKTLKYILNKYFEGVDVKVATWIYKRHSEIEPDFYVKQFDKERIVFPYEIYE